MTISSKIESLIADAPLSAHLATSVEDRPHVAPVWYGYRNGVLHFITGGRKLANVRENPRVALSIEKAVGGDVEWNVTVRGTATVREDPDRIERASEWIYDKYDADDEESDETRETDGGEFGEEQPEAALIEVEIGSGSANVYD